MSFRKHFLHFRKRFVYFREYVFCLCDLIGDRDIKIPFIYGICFFCISKNSFCIVENNFVYFGKDFAYFRIFYIFHCDRFFRKYFLYYRKHFVYFREHTLHLSATVNLSYRIIILRNFCRFLIQKTLRKNVNKAVF